jgi:glycyl-tRNA synthetase beta chain
MPDFLLELLSEEIPARMQPRAREDLARLFAAELAKSGLKAEAIKTFSTPRRLALIARDLPPETQSQSEELKGPRTSAPPQALEGFLRKTGLTQDQLTDRDGVWFAQIDKPGRPTTAVLAEAIPAIVRAFPWPKSMRWGHASLSTESLRWVRPLQGIVALFGEEIVPLEIDGVHSGAATVGHRFHHPGRITIGSAEDYAAKLRACHVIVDHEEREAIIATGATTLAAQAGLELVRDEALLRENAGLTEWPVPLLGRFDESFLAVPPEVIQLTMATNQKYFACTDAHGQLAPAFICTANLDATDAGAAIVAGNQKVLAARLSDAKFFWEQDLKVSLEDQAKKLDQIVFHEKLGTVADKVERVAKLARWLVESGVIPAKAGTQDQSGPTRSSTSDLTETLGPGVRRDDSGELATLAETAARLCKADLVTGMVGEFPELQGVMGGYYARAQGLPDPVADAIRDHYKPVGQGDEVPTAPVTVAVSLADKLDTVAGFFLIKEKPTGSRDPFALRRATLGIVNTIITSGIRISIWDALIVARSLLLETINRRRDFFEVEAWDEQWEDIPGLRWDDLPGSANELLAVAGLDESHRNYWSADRWGYSAGRLSDADDHVRLASLENLVGEVLIYILDRLEEATRRSGVRVDLIRAVVPKTFVTFDVLSISLDDTPAPPPRKYGVGVYRLRKKPWDASDDLVRLLARVEALQAFVETAEGRDLLAGYKRAANILKKEGWSPSLPSGEGLVQGIPQTGEEDPLAGLEELRDALSPEAPSYSPEPAEAALIAALDAAEPRAREAVAREEFEGAMQALASLRGPVDAFFDQVTVNDPVPEKRAARLALLARVRDAVHQVADFSRIEG